MSDAARGSDFLLIASASRQQEVEQLMTRLRELLDAHEPADDAQSELAAAESLRRDVERMQREHRARSRILPPLLASEPAWPMLLELLAAALNREAVSVKQLTYASGAPPTTALRWINILVEQGYAVRQRCEKDARLTLLSLSGRGRAALQDYFRHLEEQGRE